MLTRRTLEIEGGTAMDDEEDEEEIGAPPPIAIPPGPIGRTLLPPGVIP